MATDAKVPFEIGVAPMPVADDEADSYGKGFLSGTIMGIAPASEKQNAAWELVEFMTSDTKAVVDFANGIRNVPSTLDALNSPTSSSTRVSRPSWTSPSTPSPTLPTARSTDRPTSRRSRTSASSTRRAR
ncbi:hypothetical protein NKH18_17055 [Streptomyces sp. M10(2022)]